MRLFRLIWVLGEADNDGVEYGVTKSEGLKFLVGNLWIVFGMCGLS